MVPLLLSLATPNPRSTRQLSTIPPDNFAFRSSAQLAKLAPNRRRLVQFVTSHPPARRRSVRLPPGLVHIHRPRATFTFSSAIRDVSTTDGGAVSHGGLRDQRSTGHDGHARGLFQSGPTQFHSE